jgi:dephospho-CoA kinase
VLGLIGGIGSGKSQVAAMLAKRRALVIDADTVGHDLLAQRAVRERLLARFGSGILAADSTATIDRRALGSIVFADPAALKDLEAILHPRMRRQFERTIARVAAEGTASAIVLDAAILLEAGWNTLCDKVVFVDAPRGERLKRLTAQRGWDERVLAARERAQWPLDHKKQMADIVLRNSIDLGALEHEVDCLWESLQSAAERDPSTSLEGQGRYRSALPSDPFPTPELADAPRRG